ncbi:hypothetical protein [Methanosarcina sp. Kolksee]|uniref:hypothetical protein n=1 Tax=Methanosarcina sp. Kolksee TaxID=1434099 RepID=UPI000AB85978|nr:hypothetical protein [Methanosarcina sp. Kolksee]
MSPTPIGVINQRNGFGSTVAFESDNLIPEPYRRDKPAQRFVMNRRNGFGSTVSGKQFFEKAC